MLFYFSYNKVAATPGNSWNLLELNLLLEDHSWKLIYYQELLENL